MPPLKLRPLVMCAAVALSLAFAGRVFAGAAENSALVMPLTGLEAGEVRQCGIRTISGFGADQLILDIALERSGKATDLVVRANAGGPSASGLSDVRLLPRTVPLNAMSGPVRTAQGLERRTPASSEKVTAFIRELMLRGTRAVVVKRERDVAIDVAGPLSASVRAAYLNCAGDLYRPGE